MTSSQTEARTGLLGQLVGLDNRFWIVNVMEMFERLAYYGVRAVIAIYMVLPVEQGGPQFTHIQKGAIFAAWASVQSVLPVFTGGFADRYGHKRTIVVAILLKIVGYILMATQMSFMGFFVGCMFLAGGTAIFKPGVQGTLAATLARSNASVGWAIFYQLVNIGGFLGPVLAGYLRSEFSWSWVFYACAIIVSVNFLWLPFYKDPTEEQSASENDASMKEALAQLSRAVSPTLARVWTGLWALLLAAAIGYWVKVGLDPEQDVLIEWMYAMWAGLFLYAFARYLAGQSSYDAGRTDPHSVFVVSVVGLFQHRVLWFCILFAGFWLMFNQVFDLLPNVIDDWVDTSMVIGALGSAFATPTTPTLLAIFLAGVVGVTVGGGVLLAGRPDQREAADIPWNAYIVMGIATSAAWYFPMALALGGGGSSLGAAVGLGALTAGGAYATRISAKVVAAGAAVIAAGAGVVSLRGSLMGSSEALTKLAEEGAQINPEWMINLNPGLIVFTVVFFGYLASFVRPLTSILIGMLVATLGSVVAGTAVVGWSCLAGIAIFSVGEMLSSPKKMEFLATLAKKGQEGTFMGYANMPVAIGWILGSIGAGTWYEKNGDKINLAKRHLVEKFGADAAELDALPRSEVVPLLAQKMSLTELEVQRALFEAYDPHVVWYWIALTGVVSIVGMVAYSFVLRRMDARAEAGPGAA